MAPFCFSFLPVRFIIITVIHHQSYTALTYSQLFWCSFRLLAFGMFSWLGATTHQQQEQQHQDINGGFCSVRPLFCGCVCLPWCACVIFIYHSCPPILLLHSSHQHPRQCGFMVMIIMMINCHHHQQVRIQMMNCHHHQQDQNSNSFGPRHQAFERMCLKCEVP